MTTPANLASKSDALNHEGSQSASTTLLPESDSYTPHGDIPNTPLVASLISTTLGAVAASALALTLSRYLPAVVPVWAKPQLGVYLVAWAVFHLCEFWTTAGWNVRKLSVDAFLLNNGAQYHIAHLFGLAEFILSSYFWPSKFQNWWTIWGWLALGVPVLLAAQALRSMAMIQASISFSHIVARDKEDGHVLVTDGVYAISRHPSYTGFFYWALSTQLILGNVVSTLGFIIVLSRFFGARIQDEEYHLIKFFGKDYELYKQRVGTGLPRLLIGE